MSILKANRIENLTTTDGGINVNNSGNVGVGTSATTGRMLHVSGTGTAVQIDSSNTSNLIKFTNSAASAGFLGYQSDNLVFYTNNSERFRIDNSGNVGIGTSSPTSLLFIRGGAATATISSTTNTANLDLINSTQTTRLGASNTAFAITHNGAERMRIDSSGNVGIGTTSPTEKLTVTGGNIQVDASSRKIGFKLSGNSNAGYLIPYTSGGNTELVNERSGSSLIFKTANTERMRLTTNGLTFNGDTAAANALDDYEEGTFTPALTFSNLSVSSYSGQQGSYVKVGRQVHVSIYIRFSGSNLSGTPVQGSLVYINLPFAAGTGYSATQYIPGPAAIGRLAEFRGTNDSTDFNKIYHYVGNNSSTLSFGVNKQPASPQSTDFLYQMSEKSFNGLIGVANNFEYRHSFSYEASS